MVELQHRAIEPLLLTNFCTANPAAAVSDFDRPAFSPVKKAVKMALHGDQNGLCAYCEKPLSSSDGQVDHIKPKGGPDAHAHLCFTYANYAHSCVNNRTCGQKKKHGLLPIEPGIGCNTQWALGIDGTIEPVGGLTRTAAHDVRQTRDMLGLNADSNLVDERRKWFSRTIEILQQEPAGIQIFLQDVPFRHILATVLGGDRAGQQQYE